jgi:hypothetical protein
VIALVISLKVVNTQLSRLWIFQYLPPYLFIKEQEGYFLQRLHLVTCTPTLLTDHLPCLSNATTSTSRFQPPSITYITLLYHDSLHRPCLPSSCWPSCCFIILSEYCFILAESQFPINQATPDSTAAGNRGEAVLDSSGEPSHPNLYDTTSSEPDTPHLLSNLSNTTASAHSSAAPSAHATAPQTHRQNRNQTQTGIANIDSSAARFEGLPGQAPARILGRRQRSPAPDRRLEPSTDRPYAPDDHLIAEPRAKRRRGNVTMGGSDILDPHNGAPLGISNGSSEVSSGVTNGNKTALNGSSARDKNNSAIRGNEPSSKYFGHDREEVTRLLIQALSDMGYRTAADNVSQESGYELESPTVAGFRSAVLTGSWPRAEELLAGASLETEDPGNGLVLAPGADPNAMRFWLRQQKFLELLEQKDTSKALIVLRSELTPLSHDTGKLHFLSGLLMCRSVEDLMAKAEWDGASGQSRKLLLSELSSTFSVKSFGSVLT